MGKELRSVMAYFEFPYLDPVQYYLEAKKIDLTPYCYGYHHYARFTDGKDHIVVYKDPIFVQMEKEYGVSPTLPPAGWFD